MESPRENELDVVVVGAGFGGLWITHKLRENGLKVQCFERGSAAGGVWHWNCYPGARVDSHYPTYQFTDKELWNEWTWSEKFPGREELCRYFEYVEDKWDLKKNIRYNTTVVAAVFNESTHKWIITNEDNSVTRCRYFIPALGFAGKRYVPEFKNMGNFKGECFHSSSWPQGGIDLKGERVAVFGTGATGVQIIQDIAPTVKQMTVYQRTPNTPVPMRQIKISKEIQDQQKASGSYEKKLEFCKTSTFGGFDYQFVDRTFNEDSMEQRRQIFERAWNIGGFAPLASIYKDAFTNMECSDAITRFWAEKQGARITDPRKRAIICPTEPKFAFGAKRMPMEQNYFEAYNQEHVDVIDLNVSPVVEFTPKGIKTEKEGEIHFDVIILATGFDAVTGGLTQINIRGTDGVTLKERWQNEGIFTNLGLACYKYPNMFFIYGPQAPTAFSNGPALAELQGEFVAQLIEDMRAKGQTKIEAKRENEETWRKMTNDTWNSLTFGKATGNSWYIGANIPGKKREALNWMGGLPFYIQTLKICREKGYDGFTLS